MTFFSPTSVWNTPVDGSAGPVTIDQESAAVIAYLNTIPIGNFAFNLTAYDLPIFHATAATPTQKITVSRPAGQGIGWTQEKVNQLQAVWDAVPIPPGFAAAEGWDKAVTVIRGFELWDLQGLSGSNGAYRCTYGGYTKDYRTDPGVFSAASDWGGTAPGFPFLAGVVTIADAQAAAIEHAIGFACPSRKGWVAAPGHRSDGRNVAPHAIVEGSRIRIDPAVDVTKLGLHPFTVKMAKAAQRYGMLCNNSSSAYAMAGEDAKHLAANPWPALLGEGAQRVAQELWTVLRAHGQLLKMELSPWP